MKPTCTLVFLAESFAVCQLADGQAIPWGDAYVFLASTPFERSLVCLEAHVPSDTPRVETGFCAFRVEGELDFGLVGILAGITGALAQARIPVFAVSTFATDYVLLKRAQRDAAVNALARAGYAIKPPKGGWEDQDAQEI